MLQHTCSRSSGTATMPMFGSIVQKGKLAASALPFSHMALNSVDCMQQVSVSTCQQPASTVPAMALPRTLPTFGNPTMPVFSAKDMVD